jgi:large subunit ribosomal protein L1
LNGVRFRTDKNGIIHCTIGTIKMSANALKENLTVLMADLRKQKPTTAKGTYFKRMTLSTTMGPGIMIDLAPFMG